MGAKIRPTAKESGESRKKAEAARKKIPKKTEYSLERVFDEKQAEQSMY